MDGETLETVIGRGELSVGDVIAIGMQVAAALRAAHARGIVHRDIKPANIFVLSGNVVKVVDFGISKCPAELAASQSMIRNGNAGLPDAPSLTLACGRMGTLRYMAPEQLRGGSADTRSDIFSFGVVLYEMIAGRPPFEGTTLEAMIDAVDAGPPRALETLRAGMPPRLSRIVAICLAANPEARWQTAEQVLTELEQVTTAHATSGKPGWVRRAVAAAICAGLVGTVLLYRAVTGEKAIESIAVLPFTIATGSEQAGYLTDGITEAIINNLSAAPRLKVIARTTVFRFRGQEVDPQKVGRELKVEAVLMGKVSAQGDSLLVQTDLVRVDNGSELWGDRFRRKASDIQILQSDIAGEIADRLRLKLNGEERQRLSRRYTASHEAYQQYLKGISSTPPTMHSPMIVDLQKGVNHLEQAIAMDPNFSRAYVALAESYYALGVSRYWPAKVAFAKAKSAASQALRIEPDSGDAHVQFAKALWNLDWDWTGAEKEFRRAIVLNTNPAHAPFSTFLMQTGRTEEALKEAQRALEVDPLSTATLRAVAYTYSLTGTDEALEVARRAADGKPFFAIPYILSSKGLYSDAIGEFRRLLGFSGLDAAVQGHLARAYIAAGRIGEGRSILRKLEDAARTQSIGAYEVAFLHAALGRKDEAFKWLDIAYEQRDPGLTYLKVDYTLEPLRTDPRFLRLERLVGLSH